MTVHVIRPSASPIIRWVANDEHEIRCIKAIRRRDHPEWSQLKSTVSGG